MPVEPLCFCMQELCGIVRRNAKLLLKTPSFRYETLPFAMLAKSRYRAVFAE